MEEELKQTRAIFPDAEAFYGDIHIPMNSNTCSDIYIHKTPIESYVLYVHRHIDFTDITKPTKDFNKILKILKAIKELEE